MKALVFAAGLGTRLRPITDLLPKALVQVGGKPLLYHVVSKLKAAGVSEVVINVHHFADSIIGYVHEQDDFGMKISFSDERDFLRETGGGISYARKYFTDGLFLIHNVDILSNLDIRWFVSQAGDDALANILVSERETQRYLLFNDDMFLVGWTNTVTGEVKSPYKNLNPDNCGKFAFAGIHYVSDEVFNVFDEDGWNGRFSIIDFYVSECAKHKIKGVAADSLRLFDVGKSETLVQAEMFYQNLISNKNGER